MSADMFEKKYRTYSYSATRPLGSFVLKRLTLRQPSEWMRPRMNCSRWWRTSSHCQEVRKMGRLCLRPGPCWGKSTGHSFHPEYTWKHSACSCLRIETEF